MWYEVVSDDVILQGDLIKECPVIIPLDKIPLKENVDLPAKIEIYNVIILSQSCDLDKKKVDLVLVCPFSSLTEFGDKDAFFKDNKGKDALRRGYFPSYHLLNKCEIGGFETDFMVTDFHRIYTVPYDVLMTLVGDKAKRLRLLSPYREHLSQAFARFFMRVGLPADIPSFGKFHIGDLLD